ncbi:hypothetical protein PVAG01_03667 [Phlyctema vagabunda]|uniref:Phospholipid metabolism enzyme regulator n=1 Tax=Phlyctema vagabunda TaxID=108571 RepID=A0ABR4PN79_9HELO
MDDRFSASSQSAKAPVKSTDPAATAAGPEDFATMTSRATSSTTSLPLNTTTTTPTTTATKKASQHQQQKRGPSATNSPLPSRESSPVRPSLKNTAAVRSAPGRSRKNSHDISPPRANSITNPPSLAATQRALSAVSIPSLHPSTSDPSIKAPIPLKPSLTAEIKDSPRWPTSPSLRSPPPLNKPSIVSPRKAEYDLPAINVQRSSQTPELQDPKGAVDTDAEDSLAPGMRTAARGASGGSSTLETVQEISQPGTPASGLDGTTVKGEDGSVRQLNEQDNMMEMAFGKNPAKQNNTANESGSESGGKGDIKMRSASATPSTASRAAPPTKQFTAPSAPAGRGKPSGEGGQKMTVETETVSSIPAIALGAGVGGAGPNGSLRAKPSSETIRPKREKKKVTRKAPSVSGMGEKPSLARPRKHYQHTTRSPSKSDSDSASTITGPIKDDGQGSYSSGDWGSSAMSPRKTLARRPSLINHVSNSMLTRPRPASSKADIFEAKVASAVDEANSSDSEETFVYESNPPDANDRPRRFHSRTPSATSMASQVDQRNGMRSMIEGGHSVAMKKSMKFANSYTSNGPETNAGEDDGKGTARSHAGTGRGTTHHHHIGRWGRNGHNGHPSLFDNESPFPNASKSKLASPSPRNGSRPTSPRVSNHSRLLSNSKRQSPISSGYDIEADDERTPLMSTIRSGRSGRARRPPTSSMRQMEHQASRQHRSLLTRFAGCLVLTLMIVLVISGAVGFMFATTQPLTGVKVLALKNVLASEQELIVDLQVVARNPNLVVVTIDSMDMLLFAKSKHAGTDSEWWKHPSMAIKQESRRRGWRNRRDDSPLDPPLDGDPNTNPNLEIGHIHEFESPLTFEGSPFHHTPSVSLGELRVYKPGNKTEPGGSERWGRVVQHEFDLIIRGSLKYTLPLSQKIRSVTVEGRVTVKPNAADQDPDSVHII